MIFKSLSRKSNGTQLLRYVLGYTMQDKISQKSKKDASVILHHNLIHSKSMDGYIKAFKENEQFRLYKRKDSVVLHHTILSFHPREKQKVSDKILRDMAQKFVELRAQSCLCLIVAHKEKNNTHLHALVSGVQTNGYSSKRISKQEFNSIIEQLEAYQRETFPELTYSQNTHQKKQPLSKNLLEHLQNSRQSNKLSILPILENAYKNATSYEDFLNRITTNTCQVYYRNGLPQGILQDGIKYCFSNLGFNKEQFDELYQRTPKNQKMLEELKQIRMQPENIRAGSIIQEPAVGMFAAQPSSFREDLERLDKIRQHAKSFKSERRIGNVEERNMDRLEGIHEEKNLEETISMHENDDNKIGDDRGYRGAPRKSIGKVTTGLTSDQCIPAKNYKY